MSNKLEQQLDECIELLRDGQSINEVLTLYAEQSGELGPLLGIVSDLQSLPSPVVSSQDVLQAFIKTSAKQIGAGKARQYRVRFFSMGFLMRAAAILIVVFLGDWATMTASADAVPGDWLYPIKRFTERAKFFLTVNQEDKAELRIIFSSERLKEAVKQHQRTGQINQALLDEMLREARLAAQSSETLPNVSHILLAGQAEHLSKYQQQILGNMQTKASEEQRKILARYAQMCGQRAQWMREMCDWQEAPSQSTPSHQRENNRGRERWPDRCPQW